MKKLFGCPVASVAAMACLGMAASVQAIVPNPNLSIGQKLYVDGAVNTNWLPEVYTDGHLDFNQVASATELALKVGEGPSKIFITWETRGDEAWIGDQYVHAASCQHNPKADASLQNFKILTSGNSTDGVDGDWTEVAKVGESGAMSRGIAIDFAGKSWFKIVAKSAVTNLEEIGAYDMSNGGTDTWFFMGTSISQMGMKAIEVDSNFAQLIHARYPDYYPVMLRGGIGCVTSSGVIDGLAFYSEYAGNVKYWAIEMGTNDAWGGYDTNVGTFRSNMETIIKVAKRNGVTPIIARMIATNPEVAGWQVNEKFLTVIDELTAANNLPKGPDFFDYFSKHPEELSADDGVHPAEKGAASMHRLWAEAVAPLYDEGISMGDTASKGDEGDSQGIAPSSRNMKFAVPQVSVNNGMVHVLNMGGASRLTLFDSMGHEVMNRDLPVGSYFVLIRDREFSYSAKVRVK